MFQGWTNFQLECVHIIYLNNGKKIGVFIDKTRPDMKFSLTEDQFNDLELWNI